MPQVYEYNPPQQVVCSCGQQGIQATFQPCFNCGGSRFIAYNHSRFWPFNYIRHCVECHLEHLPVATWLGPKVFLVGVDSIEQRY